MAVSSAPDSVPRHDAFRCSFIGPAGAEIVAWLHRGAGDSPHRTGVVLCGTLGAESLSTHWPLRVLAESLAARGCPCLRFDYAGTGDSADGAVQVSTCVANVRTAIRSIRTLVPLDRVVLLGLRLGSLFAMEAARSDEVAGLVLWGPAVSGRRFAREWKRLARSAGGSDAPDDAGEIHAAGFALPQAFLDDLAAIDLLESRPAGAPACLVVEREELPPEDTLVARLQALGLSTARLRPGGFLEAMMSDPHLAKLPVAAIREMGAWIANVGQDASPERPGARMAPVRLDMTAVSRATAGAAADGAVRERFLDPEQTGGLFGVVSEPADGAAWNGQCVILLNSGSMHHIGPNRMYVTIARRLAAQGSRVCRADLDGLGDSRVRAGARENDPYPAGALDDVAGLIQALDRCGEPSRRVLLGLCSGAWASFQAALVFDRITAVVLLNPDFYGERSVVGKPPSFVRQKDFSHYKHSARSWRKWKKLMRGEADLTKIRRVLWNQARLKLASWATHAAGGHHQLDDDLAALAGRGVRVGFIFSPGDGAIDFLAMNGRNGLERLRRAGLLSELTIDGADHTFSPARSQAELLDTLSNWLRA
jgi:alpha-beta hydrolase superfamily lysophospholipase